MRVVNGACAFRLFEGGWRLRGPDRFVGDSGGSGGRLNTLGLVSFTSCDEPEECAMSRNARWPR
jgi:hypothetical protein